MSDLSVPETFEGWSVLHQMFSVRWPEVRRMPASARRELVAAAVQALECEPDDGASALVQLLGHKGDLMAVHFRRGFEELGALQLRLAQTPLWEYLQPTTSYVSIVELGMYELTAKLHEQLVRQGLELGSVEYREALAREAETQRGRVSSRLFIEIPRRRHVCFYPMNKRRGEAKNWYSLSFQDRTAMMREHGAIGRAYAGQITQVISGSIGFDDWEWGVDLFADDPLVFKKLIYEMRFDRASADYAEFGPFYVGLQFDVRELERWLGGKPPRLNPEP